MSGSGGADSTAGFRYQHLVTIEAILDQFDANPEGDWLVGVDVRGQDSADFAVLPAPAAKPQRAVQVKASSPTSSTQLTLPSVVSILSALYAEHPRCEQYEIRTNRRLTGPASRAEASLREGKPVDGLDPIRARHSVLRVAEGETVESLSARLRARVLKYRVGVHAEVAGNITQLVIARMRDLVDEKASSAQDQYITAHMVGEILKLPGQQLSQASGGRQFGRLLGVPVGEVIRRGVVADFLDHHLVGASAASPQLAVVTGPSGAGKSSAVSAWATQRSERYFCVVWLSARSEQILQSQLPTLLEQLGVSWDSTRPAAEALRETLSHIPFPWLLVLDDVSSVEAVTDWIPLSGYGDVVITSQDSTWPPSHAPSLRIDGFTESECAALIFRRLGSGANSERLSPESVTRLADAMGRWPLALDMACHWIARRGGDIANLNDYLDRLDEVDLDEKQSVPVHYPRTAVAAILMTWYELSEPARTMLVLAILCGGQDVPLQSLSRACWQVPGIDHFELESVLAELASASIITRFRKDSRGFGAAEHDRIAVHESLCLVSEGRLAYPAAYLKLLNDVLAKQLKDLRENGRVQAAVSYLPASVSVLAKVAQVAELDEQLPFAPAMHNAGDLLLLTGSDTRGAVWLRQAMRVYAARIEAIVEPDPVLIAYYLASAARFTVALLQIPRIDLVEGVVLDVLPVAEEHRESARSLPAQAALRALEDAFARAGFANDAVEKRLRLVQLEFRDDDDRALPGTVFDRWMMSLAAAADAATTLAWEERWSEALDSFLVAANAAQDKGVLQYDVVETGISVGIALVASLRQRGLAMRPVRWSAAWDRFLEWRQALENVAAHQQARFQILRGLVDAAPDLVELRRSLHVIQQHRDAPLRSTEVEIWSAQVAFVEEEQAQRLPWQSLQVDQLEGMNIRVFRTRDGGDEVLVWFFLAEAGPPGAAFLNVSATMSSGRGWEDPQPAAMEAAGFPRFNTSQALPAIAEGWTAIIDDNELIITDADGIPWLTTDHRGNNTPVGWHGRVRRARYLHLIYGDVGDFASQHLEDFRHQALVRIRRKSWRWWGKRF